jgi:hypothetical protein
MRLVLMTYLTLGVVCSFWFLCVMLMMEDRFVGAGMRKRIARAARALDRGDENQRVESATGRRGRAQSGRRA